MDKKYKIRIKENLSACLFACIPVSLVAWLIIGCSSIVDGVFSWWGFISFTTIGIIVGIFIASSLESSKEEEQTYKKICDGITNEREKIAELYDNKFGKCIKEIFSSGNSFYYLRVYEDAKILVAHTPKERINQYTECRFEDILSREFNGETIAPHTENKADNASIIGRAAAGAVIAGPVGAIIGGVTSTPKTVTSLGGVNKRCMYLYE